jgi:hypothetical protein
MPNSEKPTPQMLENLDLLLSMDLLLDERDWKVIEKLNSPATANKDGDGKDDNEDDDDER